MRFFCFSVRSRKSLLLLLVITVGVLVLAECAAAASNIGNSGIDTGERIYFLRELGYYADYSTEKQKTVQIPEKFSDIYENYNNLQKSAGFDLKKYAGLTAEMYEYKLESDAVNRYMYAHLLVYDGKIIGGDICDSNINGEMLPLVKKE